MSLPSFSEQADAARADKFDSVSRHIHAVKTLETGCTGSQRLDSDIATAKEAEQTAREARLRALEADAIVEKLHTLKSRHQTAIEQLQTATAIAARYAESSEDTKTAIAIIAGGHHAQSHASIAQMLEAAALELIARERIGKMLPAIAKHHQSEVLETHAALNAHEKKYGFETTPLHAVE